MKQRFFKPTGLLMLAAGLMAVALPGCKEKDPEVPTLASITIKDGDGKNIAKDQVLQAEKDGDEFDISVTSTRGWKITADQTWVTFTPNNGETGAKTVTVKVTANTGEQRTAVVTAETTTDKASLSFKISQGGTVPAGDITISEIRAMAAGTITADKTLIATVISDANETTGYNTTSANNIVIQDASAGIAIRFAAKPTNTYSVGDVLSIKVKDLTLAEYNLMTQLNNVPEAAVTKTGNTNVIDYKSITPAQLLSGNYESTLVAVSDVQFISDHAGLAVNDAKIATISGNKHSGSTLESSDGKTFTVFVSAYAAFYKTPINLPNGSGVMKGIAGINKDADGNTEYQIQPRTAADFAGMTGNRFAEAARFGVSKTEVPVIAAGGSAQVDVTGNVAWSVNVKDGGGNINGEPAPKSGTGAGTIKLDFKENTSTTETKVVTITVSTTADAETKSFDVVFTQAKATAAGEPFPFEVVWNLSDLSTAAFATAPRAYTTLTAGSEAVVGSLTPNFPATSGTPAAYGWGVGGFEWAANNATNPSQYATFTVTAPAGSTFALTSLNANIRRSSQGPSKTILQYKVDDGSYTQAIEWTEMSETGNKGNNVAVDFSSITALQGVAGGTVVTFRFVPHTATGNGTWYLNGTTQAGNNQNALWVKGSVTK